jgi:hypothetical protein
MIHHSIDEYAINSLDPFPQTHIKKKNNNKIQIFISKKIATPDKTKSNTYIVLPYPK